MNADLLATRRGGLALFALFLLAVFALLRPALHELPAWDTSSGLFPAALTLAENGFDLADLLARPGWAHGGPNIHPFSSVTWGTAALLWAFPERELWLPLLHALHFGLAAGTMLGAQRLASVLLPPALALATPFVLLLWPLFQVQAGYLYTEMPLALCSVWALRSHALSRYGWAAFWSALSCSVKEAGLVVPAALVAATLLEHAGLGPRLLRLAGLLLPAVGFVALNLFVALPVEEASGVRPLSWSAALGDAARKLRVVPDLALLLLAFAGVALATLPASLLGLRARPVQPAARVRALALLLAGAFAGFYVLVPLTAVEVYVLPRYYVQLTPFVLLLLLDAAARWLGARGAAALAVALALFFVANRRGEFMGWYPPVPGNEFSLAERSLEYRDLLAVQRELVEAAALLPEDVQLFYGLPEHFLFAWPRMGYVKAPRSNAHCVWLERGRLPPPSAQPERFALLYNFVGYGGGLLQALQRQAERDPARRLRATPFVQGRYRTLLVEVGPAPPPADRR